MSRPVIFLFTIFVMVIFFGAFRFGKSSTNQQVKILEKILHEKASPPVTPTHTSIINLFLNQEIGYLNCGIEVLLPKGFSQNLKIDFTEVVFEDSLLMTYSCDPNFIKKISSSGANTSQLRMADIAFDSWEENGHIQLISGSKNIYISVHKDYLDTLIQTFAFNPISPISELNQ